MAIVHPLGLAVGSPGEEKTKSFCRLALKIAEVYNGLYRAHEPAMTIN